ELDLLGVILDLFDHLAQAGELELAGLGIDLGADLGLGAIAGLGRLLDGVLHRLDDDGAVDRLLAGDCISDLQQFESVRANGHYSFSSETGLASSVLSSDVSG